MKCIIFVLEVKDTDIKNGVVDKEMLINSFNECVDDFSKYDNVCGETNNHKNQFDMFRVDIKHVFDICEAVTKPSKKE